MSAGPTVEDRDADRPRGDRVMTNATGLQRRSTTGEDHEDFSVIPGGPLFQMLRRAELPLSELLKRLLHVVL